MRREYSVKQLKTQRDLDFILDQGIQSWKEGYELTKNPKGGYILRADTHFRLDKFEKPLQSGERYAWLNTQQASLLALIMTKERYVSEAKALELIVPSDGAYDRLGLLTLADGLRRKIEIEFRRKDEIGVLNDSVHVIQGFYSGHLPDFGMTIGRDEGYPKGGPEHGYWGLRVTVNSLAKFVLQDSGWGHTDHHTITPKEAALVVKELDKDALRYTADAVILINRSDLTKAVLERFGERLRPSEEFKAAHPKAIEKFGHKDLVNLEKI